MAKCKKGTIWDSETKKCRVPNFIEKKRMREWEKAKGMASRAGLSLGASAGILTGAAYNEITGKKASPLGFLATIAAGSLIGRHKAIKIQKEKSDPPYTNVPSRRKTRKKKKKGNK
tara:strand:- start:498 stop:845 length:348 start_codon:yes stop_codon:yes gene_type:complete